MRIAYPKQKFQDWFTQQWAIFRGRKVNPETVPWLMGPIGNLGSNAVDFVEKLAKSEGLIIDKKTTFEGLIPDINKLQLSEQELTLLSDKVIDFYKHTANYHINFSLKWNPFFKVFGKLITVLFSNRIKQLNIPTNQSSSLKEINSEITTLSDPISGEIKYTVWYRSYKATGQVIYSGVYTTCILPSGKSCVKAIFPLPNGNATVIMTPSVADNGSLSLDASGKKFGDPGFYFLLTDSKKGLWSQYISSFRDLLVVSPNKENISTEQTLTLWGIRVLRFNYKINRK